MRDGTRLALGISTLAILAACGGSGDTLFGSDDGGGDSGTGDAGGAGDSGNPADGGPSDGASTPDATADASPPPDAAADAGVCAPLAAGATDVYVDSRFTGSPATGARACPLPTILKGMAAAALLSGTRTVHVAGSTPALVYGETSAVPVAANVILQGDGPAKTVLNAAGTCGSGICAVMLAGGGTIDGIAVTSPGASGGDGIVAAHASPAPVVKNVTANGCKGSGVLALGAIELGPNIVASNNGAQGVQSPAAANGLVHVVAGANSFDGNAANGVNIDGAATLSFEGGTASGNTFNGVRLFGVNAPAALTAHTIAGLTATLNKNTGISVFNSQSLTLRSSKLLTNANLGLFYIYAQGTALDLGPPGSTGGNVFGGATVADRNGKAGVYLCRARGAATQSAEGNSWAACPPTQTSMAACDVMPSAYTDVAYATAPATTPGAPVVATTCTVGP